MTDIRIIIAVCILTAVTIVGLSYLLYRLEKKDDDNDE